MSYNIDFGKEFENNYNNYDIDVSKESYYPIVSDCVSLAKYNNLLHNYEELKKNYDTLLVEYQKLLENKEA
jgi:hypothetical protein